MHPVVPPSLTSAFPLARPPTVLTRDDILQRFLDYVDSRGIVLYEAQEKAILELLEGANVILKTPTGSGKSLVATALHYASLCQGGRSAYTSPIKALVNEKFLALCQDFGPEAVGISTGDATVNKDAPILCCTAEVLANMALCEGPELNLHAAILDEFHFYSDRERGVAWQIPLLTLPQVRFLLLSATLGDTAFFEREITRLTSAPTVTVVSDQRPVPLHYEYTEEAMDVLVQLLQQKNRLPAYFVHPSQRSACASAQSLMSLELCSRTEKDKLVRHLEEVRFDSPFGHEMKKYLRHGIGLHHAGLLPKYRVLVEKLARLNLLKIICGTDTLGVGVNVPIRSVIFTSLSKFDGQKMRIMPVRDFHQIAGRAGRRGFDEEGFVIAMAPEHVIENRKEERKARENPTRAKKAVKHQAPEGFVHWDEKTFRKLVAAAPEPLTSSFKLGHGLLLSVLSRRGDGCRAMRQLIADCHEPARAKPELRRRAFALFRSLVEKRIVEILPQPEPSGRKVRLHVELQEDFSLHQTLSLFLVDTVRVLSADDPEYAYKVLALCESVLENPEVILRQQVDKLKAELLREMKTQDIPYEERMARLEEVERPKPYGDFIYGAFNAFAEKYPWVGKDNIQPKSIGLAMYERYLGFADYVRELDLQRAEGILLRHLTALYKTLSQTVPESCRTEEIENMLVYFEDLVRGVDSSLLEEWEFLRHPEKVLLMSADKMSGPRPLPPLDPIRQRNELERMIRHGIFQFLRPLSFRDFKTALATLDRLSALSVSEAGEGHRTWTIEGLEKLLHPYFEEGKTIRLDPAARHARNTRLAENPFRRTWEVRQTLVDREESNTYALLFTVDLEATCRSRQVRLQLEGLERF